MKNQAFDLLLLATSLSQLKDQARVITLFIEGMNNIFPELKFNWTVYNTSELNNSIEVCTRQETYGFINYTAEAQLEETSWALIHNSSQMLGVILEKLKQEQVLIEQNKALEALASERALLTDKLELRVAARTADLESANVNLAVSRLAALDMMAKAVEARQRAEASMVALQHEVTERKQAEEALLVSQQRLALHIQQTPLAVIEWDLEGHVLEWNASATRIFGYARAEAIGQHWAFIVPEIIQGQVYSLWDSIVKQQGGSHYSNQNRTKNGQIIVCDWFNTPLIDSNGISFGVASQVMDITERIQAIDEIYRLNDELEQRVVERTAQFEMANKELESFSYSVSHDLRAPLRAIDGFVHIIEDDYIESLPAEGARLLGIVRANARRMEQLIDDLLRFSQMGRQALSKQSIQPADLVQEALENLRHEREGRQVEIAVGELPDCEGDPLLLLQVWVNLLSNAIKYTRKRAIARIEVSGQVNKNGEKIYCVKDNGVGFDMRFASKLFGVFQRFHRADEFEGTGVGLALAQRIIQRHGGRIWADSEPEVGTTFYFSLP